MIRAWLPGVVAFALGLLLLPFSCVQRCGGGRCVTQRCESPFSLVTWPGGVRGLMIPLIVIWGVAVALCTVYVARSRSPKTRAV
jgi:hypothetical protein